MTGSCKLGIVLAAGMLLALSGCQDDKKQPAAHSGDFLPDNKTVAVNQIADMQASAGSDWTLYSSHFGPDASLNSMGRSKIDRMLHDAAPVVYIDINGTDAALNQRRATVEQYLRDSNVPDGTLAVQTGPNPGASFAASDSLSRKDRAESLPGSADESGRTTSSGRSQSPSNSGGQ